MTDKLANPRKNPTHKRGGTPPSQKKIDAFKLHLLNEFHAGIMILIFMSSAFTIVSYFNITVISIIDASRWFALFAGSGFIALFLVRNKLQLSILDGLFYNVFGIAPVLLALGLLINSQCDETFDETYRVLGTKKEGSGFTLKLEGDTLGDYWHIRNLDRDEGGFSSRHVKYSFCNGLLGYKVMKDREMVP